MLRASEVVLAVEIVSPGSERTDHTVKPLEYADAGIPHYWVVDLGEPGDRITLTAHHLAGEFGYGDAGPVAGTFSHHRAVPRPRRPRPLRCRPLASCCTSVPSWLHRVWK